MHRPKVSILIPFKNTEAFLKDCISSILEQEYTNWEVIAVDDNSIDDSNRIVEHFAKRDQRIKIFKNKGKGIIPALRTAYNNCQGSLITRMDSDDIMVPSKIQIMAASLISHGHGHVAIGQVKYFSDRGISDGYERYEKWLNKLTSNGINYTEIYKECVIPSPCWMVFKEDFNKCGAFEPNTYPEDYDLTFRFYENGLKCIPCKTILHYWRDYDHRTSRTSEHYAQNYFLNIKLNYFLKLDYNKNRPLVIWGAGFKGKNIAKKLVQHNIDFYWICDNPKKIGKDIYGKRLDHFSIIDGIPGSQSIITVANEGSQLLIKEYFANLNRNAMEDYFFFC